MTDQEFDALDDKLSRIASAYSHEGGEHQIFGADLDFHSAIIARSESARLYDALLGETYPLIKMYRYTSQCSPGRLIQAVTEHRAILAAMRSRDAQEAEDLMKRHIRNARINLVNSEYRAFFVDESASLPQAGADIPRVV